MSGWKFKLKQIFVFAVSSHSSIEECRTGISLPQRQQNITKAGGQDGINLGKIR